MKAIFKLVISALLVPAALLADSVTFTGAIDKVTSPCRIKAKGAFECPANTTAQWAELTAWQGNYSEQNLNSNFSRRQCEFQSAQSGSWGAVPNGATSCELGVPYSGTWKLIVQLNCDGETTETTLSSDTQQFDITCDTNSAINFAASTPRATDCGAVAKGTFTCSDPMVVPKVELEVLHQTAPNTGITDASQDCTVNTMNGSWGGDFNDANDNNLCRAWKKMDGGQKGVHVRLICGSMFRTYGGLWGIPMNIDCNNPPPEPQPGPTAPPIP